MKKLLTAGAVTAWSLSLAFGAEQTERSQQPSLQQDQQQEARQQQQQQQQPEFGAPERRGQEKQEREKEAGEYGARPGGAHQKLSNLEDAQLIGPDGQEIGQFEDVVIDLETGAVSFVIVAGEDDQRRPVPIASLQVSGPSEDPELTMNIDRQEFDQGPTVDRDEIAQLGQEQRAREIFEHYGEDWEAHQQQQMEFAAPPRRDREEQQQQQERRQVAPDEAQAPGQPDQAQQPEFGAPAQQQQRQEQQRQQQQEEQQATPGQQEETEFRAPDYRAEENVKLGRDLKEARVTGRDQEQIGEISDVILDLEGGFASFVIIEGEEVDGQFAVSPRALEAETEDQFRLNISSQELEQAESISQQELSARAQQQQQMETAQVRESPEVFRYEEEETAIFGAPDRQERQQQQQQQQPQQQQQQQPRADR